LNRLVTVQQRGQGQDAYGGQVTTWTDVKQGIYASINPLTSQQLFLAQSLGSKTTHEVDVRYDAIFADPKVTASYRIVYRGRVFEVQGSRNEGERDRLVTLSCTEGLTSG